MMAHVRGELTTVETNHVVVDVGGVGYKVYIPESSLSRLPAPGCEIMFFTHLYVREGALDLYGFLTADERRVFELLMGVSGIGPKVALSLTSSLKPAELERAVAAEDYETLTRVPGVGRKTAKRVVLELKDKLPALVPEGFVQETDTFREAFDALLALGYDRSEASRALEKVGRSLGDKAGVQELVRQALKVL